MKTTLEVREKHKCAQLNFYIKVDQKSDLVIINHKLGKRL